MEKARFKTLIAGVIVGGVWVGLFAMNSATAQDVDCAVMQKAQKSEKVKADVSPAPKKDPFESIRHIRPKPDKKAQKSPWTPNKKYLTDSEYQTALEQVKYWNEYYHDVYKAVDEMKKRRIKILAAKSASLVEGGKVGACREMLGLLMHRKGVRFDQKALSPEHHSRGL